MVILINHGKTAFVVKPGDRIAQMVFGFTMHAVTFRKVEDLSVTTRGNGGLGSTG